MKIIRIISAVLAAVMLACLSGCASGSAADQGSTAQNTKLEELRSDSVYILFINAGKADSALVVSGEKAYLVDMGEESSVPSILSAMAMMEVERLDAVFLTHTHSDHIGGTKAVCSVYPTDTVYTAQFSEDEEKLSKQAKKADAEQVILRAGERVDIGNGNCFEVLAPLEKNSEDDNDNSLVMMLHANGKRVLLTGDMQFAEEKTLLASGADISADILKVGNHGNPDATGESFAKAVSPKISVISTDTSVDEDSANERVFDALSMSEIYVTQDSDMGLLTEIDAAGEISVSSPERPHTGAGLEIVSASKSDQSVTVRNSGADADVSGFFIYSSKGYEVFSFPSGSVIKSGESVTVAAYGGDYTWGDDDNIFSKKKEDTAVLCDRYGNILSSCDSK